MSCTEKGAPSREPSVKAAGGAIGMLLVVASMVVLCAVAGCEYLPFGYTPVKDIINNPSAYDGKEVKVRGKVLEVTKIPFVESKFYNLAADGYEIPVMTDHSTPPANTEVVVIGKVENIAIINNQSIGLHIEETKRIDRPFW